MQPRTICLIAVFVSYVAFVFVVLANPVTPKHEEASENEEAFVNCQRTDYRTYIRCLKRQKRHHQNSNSNWNSNLSETNSCMDNCLKKCISDDDCDGKCIHCWTKLTRRHKIIYEHEAECISEDCANKNTTQPTQGPINITTIVNITNILNNSCSNSCQPPCLPCHPPKPLPDYRPKEIAETRLIHLLIMPQYVNFVPQTNIGCPYVGHWPCIPAMTTPDCSWCRPPYIEYRCDVSCYRTAIREPPVSTSCVPPYCVGGAGPGLVSDYRG